MSSVGRILIGLLAAWGLVLLLLCQAACRQDASDADSVGLDTARTAFLHGEYLRAEELYQHYLQTRPIGPYRGEAWQRLADINQYVRNAPEKTATLLETALLEFAGNEPLSREFHLRIARVRQELRDFDGAARHYRQLLRAASQYPDFFCAVSQEFSQARLKAHDPAEALALLRTCLDTVTREPYRARCALSLARLLLRQDKASEAEPLLHSLYENQALDASSRAQAGFLLATLLENRRDTAAAKTIYDTILGDYPNPLAIKIKLRHLQ